MPVPRDKQYVTASARKPFDEQYWPIAVALVILGASIAGLVLSILRLDDPRLLHNAATHLAYIPIFVGFAMWFMARVRPHWLRRVVVLSLVLSVAINTGLLTLLVWSHLGSVSPARHPLTTKRQDRKVVTVPETWVMPTPKEQVRKQWEQPISAETTEAPVVEIPKEAADDIAAPTKSTTLPSLDLDPTIVHSQSRPRAEIAETIPRQSETLSLLRRQQPNTPPRTGNARPLDARERPSQRLTDAARTAEQAVEAAPTPLQRRSSATDIEKSLVDPTSTEITASAMANLRRSNIESPSTSAENDLSLRRTNVSRAGPSRNSRVAEIPSLAGGAASAAAATADPAESTRTAITRAETGAAGLGRSDNIQSHLADAGNTAPRASDLARRELPAEVPDPVASRLAGLPGRQGQIQSDQPLPNTSTNVLNVPVASNAGLSQADEIVASNAAAPERSGTNSTVAELRAEGGASKWDIGLPQMSPGVTRRDEASGGGEPLPTDGNLATKIAKQSVSSENKLGTGRINTENLPIDSQLADSMADAPLAPANAAVGREHGAPADGGLDAAFTAEATRNGDNIASQPDITANKGLSNSVARRQIDNIGSPSDNLPSNANVQTGSRNLAANPRAATAPSVSRVELPSDGAAQGSPSAADGEAMHTLGGLEEETVIRRDSSSLAFDRDVELGVTGLATEQADDAGLDMARADALSDSLEPQETRFLRRDVGGPIATNTKADMSVAAFNRRERRFGEERTADPGRPSAKTEAAIELGLVFLSRHQAADGRWSLDRFAAGTEYEQAEQTTLRSDTAATGLGLLSFLGAGYHHLDDKYRQVVRRALGHLISHQQPDGNLYVADDRESAQSVALYSHGIAALALCEAYGMTQDPELKEPAQKSLDFIIKAQHKRLGGWRYIPGAETDTSVSGWMVMALRSGELAELPVPPQAYEKVSRWLDFAQASNTERHLYRYNPLAPDNELQRHGRTPTPVITSVGLLSRMYLGWRRDNEWMQRGSDYLLEHPPAVGNSQDPRRDTYYWYYATQVMFHMGGERWEEWHGTLYPILIESQEQQGPLAGSWNPREPVPDRWARHAGRLYVTTMNLLSLEVYYRHLPLYEETAR